MSKCWYCNNELTTGDNPKHFGICNKCYDEMFKSGDTIIRSFTNKISDLEAKLEESESKRKILEEKVKWLSEENEECFVDGQKYNELREQKDKEIQDLKQQLAEKDKEIEILTKQNKALVEEEDLLDKKLKELGVDCIEDLGKSQNQKALEQLEKVKEFVNEIYGEYSASITTNFIDNQINELKGE